MRTRDHDAAISLLFASGKIQHGRGPAPDALNIHPRRRQALDDSSFHIGRAEATIITNTHQQVGFAGVLAANQRAKAPANGASIGRK